MDPSLLGGSVPPGGTMVMSTVPMEPPESMEPPVPRFTARLVVRSAGESGDEKSDLTFEIKEGQVTLGRTPENGIQIEHASVSSVHAQLRERQGRYYIYDLGSTNGTWVNDDAVTGALLKDGSRITIGTSSLFYSRLGSAAIRPGTLGLGSRGVILVQSGPSRGHNFPVGEEDLVIGRQPGRGGAQLDDPEVALRHALLRQTPDGCLVYDLGSPGGTKVDDVALTGTALKDGDVIKLGMAELDFVQVESG